MTVPEFLARNRLDKSLLFGFYGGGNYGDELLMEVLANLLKQHDATDVSIAYQHPENYSQFHHEFGYRRVNMHSKKALLGAMIRSKHIVVGGGGLWGLDANLNVLLMSLMLCAARFILGKRVYLLAIGYYDSSTRYGRIGAWLAGKAANIIIARDDETYANFSAIQKNTYQDTDIAWHINDIDLSPYVRDLQQLDQKLRVKQGQKTVFMTLRRFKGAGKHHLAAVITSCLERNAGKPIIIALLEPRGVDPEGYRLLQDLQRSHPTIQIIDFTFNPLALFMFFRKHHDKLIFIGPQFHAILSAHLTGVPYLPLAYDNKVHNLLKHIAPQQQPIAVNALEAEHLQQFIDEAYAV